MAPASTLAYVGRASAPDRVDRREPGRGEGLAGDRELRAGEIDPRPPARPGTAGPRGSPACTRAGWRRRGACPPASGRWATDPRASPARRGGCRAPRRPRPRTRRARSTGSAGGGRGAWPRPGRTSVRAGHRTPRVAGPARARRSRARSTWRGASRGRRGRRARRAYSPPDRGGTGGPRAPARERRDCRSSARDVRADAEIPEAVETRRDRLTAADDRAAALELVDGEIDARPVERRSASSSPSRRTSSSRSPHSQPARARSAR